MELTGTDVGAAAPQRRIALGWRIVGGLVIGLLAAIMTFIVVDAAPDGLRANESFWGYVFSVVFVAMMGVYAACAWVGVAAMVRTTHTLLLIAFWGTAIPLLLPYGTGVVTLVYELINGWQGPNAGFGLVFIYGAVFFTPPPIMAWLVLRRVRRAAVGAAGMPTGAGPIRT